MARLPWVLAALLASVCWSARVDAQAAEPIRVRYQAPASCPSSADFSRQVLLRTRRARLAEPTELARVFDVRIRLDGEGDFLGELSARDSQGAAVAIRASGACQEVVRSLALVAALTVDPTALLEPPPEDALPDNPYWRQLALLEARGDRSVEARLRSNPYRSEPVGPPVRSPYAGASPGDPLRLPNPYR